MPAQNTNVESPARSAITVRGLAPELKALSARSRCP
jgi:hypothetical protein